MFGLGNPELGVLMLALFVVFILFGFPIAFTLMALGVFFGYFAMGDLIFSLLVQRSYSVMTNDVLISIPLFVFMGYIIERANILDRLFKALQLAAGPVPASLALATIATCAIFATATGIVGACVTLMGLLAFPAMLRAGYDVKIASGAVCAGGCLGILIPPSVMLILYGATAGVSVVKLYAGAFFPGIMLAGLYMLYTAIMALLNPKLAPKLPPEERNVPLTKILQALVTSFLPLAALIGAALGSIIFGLATPSEAAAMGSLGALLLAAGYGADYSKPWRIVVMSAYGLIMALVVAWSVGPSLPDLLPFYDISAPPRGILVAALLLTGIIVLVMLPGNRFF
jgi:tripartite ATP-independent transporter DctM subunit